MPRSLGPALPTRVAQLLDGTDVAAREGLTFLLLTSDADGWPHMAMLSVGELVAVDTTTLRAALWPRSGTSGNLIRSGKAVVSLVVHGAAYNVRVRAQRGDDLDLGPEGTLACFVLHVENVLEDTADYADLTSGVTFRLKQPRDVVPRWQRTVDALLAAS